MRPRHENVPPALCTSDDTETLHVRFSRQTSSRDFCKATCANLSSLNSLLPFSHRYVILYGLGQQQIVDLVSAPKSAFPTQLRKVHCSVSRRDRLLVDFSIHTHALWSCRHSFDQQYHLGNSHCTTGRSKIGLYVAELAFMLYFRV